VLVMKEGKVVFRRAYGLASVELKVPLQADMVFRIGSVTKQFTAAAVMGLVEEGKVELQAPIGRTLKELPAAWAKVTVEQLLNHTSGIPSYTNDPSFFAGMREDLPPARLLERIKTKPMDFEPGASHQYNNSGYVVLGMLVEQVTGQAYGDFLQKRYFEPLGLKHTRSGLQAGLVSGLVSGYTSGPEPAPYISMSQPFAAGALLSTVDDLARWNEALQGGRVVKPESLARMMAPTRTRDGKAWPYGFGMWSLSFHGASYVLHNGRINGFSSLLLADPRSRTVAVILSNSDDLPVDAEYLGLRLLALAAGNPIPETRTVAVEAGKLARLAGSYRAEGARRTIRVEGGRLFSQVGGSPAAELLPVSETEFAFQDSDTRLRFALQGDKVLGVHRADYDGEGPLQKRLEAGDERQALALDPAVFDALAGQYELAPGFVLKIWREGGRAFSQGTGQPPAEIFPFGPGKFFLKVVEAELEFVKDGEGRVKELVLLQGGEKLAAKRLP
jgi:CubicO group peptidase (beta-lactamase class C family)